MIEGLKVTVPGQEVKRLLEQQAEYHRSRAAFHQERWNKLVEVMGPPEDTSKMSSGQRDPRTDARERIDSHEDSARENDFMAKWINIAEVFQLDKAALHWLGVLRSRY